MLPDIKLLSKILFAKEVWVMNLGVFGLCRAQPRFTPSNIQYSGTSLQRS